MGCVGYKVLFSDSIIIAYNWRFLKKIVQFGVSFMLRFVVRANKKLVYVVKGIAHLIFQER